MTSQEKWNADRGNDTLIVDYPLDENSQVIELGAYHGLWTKKISQKFNCNILSIEPIPDFYNKMITEFDYYLKNDREKIKTENFGISTENKQITFSVDGDSTSSHLQSSNQITIDCYTLEHYLQKHNIEKVDLLQVNIECEEYPLLLDWITNDSLKNVKYLQVQFHTFCDDYENKYSIISEGLKNLGFEIRYKYDFVWESWDNKNFTK
jgi:FkbM family methyltransferase